MTNRIIYILLFPICCCAQEVVHPFSTGGTCLPKVNAFIKQGLNANTCAQIKLWADGLSAMQSSDCGRVFNFAKLSNSGNRTALDVIGNANIEKIIRLKCNDSGIPNAGLSQSNGNQNSRAVQNNTNSNGNSNMLLGLLTEKGIQNEISRQQSVTNNKGANKYTYSQEINENELESDVIFLNNGGQLKVKIIKTTENQIFYKKITIPDGPTFTVNIKSVVRIKYFNGDEKNFE